MYTGKQGVFRLEFIECEKVQGDAYCADNDCSCTLTPLPKGGGYIYISDAVVHFRKDALTLSEVQTKMASYTVEGEYISASKYAPILVCELSVMRRNLDLSVARADAQQFWNEGRVPLRATPRMTVDPFMVPPQQHEEDNNGNNTDIQSDSNWEKSENQPVTPQIVTNVEHETVSPKNEISTPLQVEPALPPPLRDVSVDEVMAQFSSGPLAELAKRMAQDAVNAPQNENRGSLEKTVITNRSSSQYVDQDDDQYQSTNPKSKKKEPTLRKQKKINYKTGKKSTVPIVLTMVGLLLFFAALAGISVYLINNFKKVKQVVVKVSPPPAPLPEVQEEPPKLLRSFFDQHYLFKDAHFSGTMSFSDVNTTSGKYSQIVKQNGKEKTFTVNGAFTYTIDEITFRPDKHSIDIIWVFDTTNDNGNYTFHDPAEGNSGAARIYLRSQK
jgi:hypothetical protein